MAESGFKKASKSQAKLRLALFGASGSGKTYSALSIATHLAPGRVAVIDTEHGSASKYADRFSFDTLELTEFSPKHYIEGMKAAAESGDYDVLVIDSLSHAWSGAGGVLEMVDKAAKRSQSNNTYTAWRDATPEHNRLVEAMLACPLHLIVTMRSKTEYVLEQNDKGKMTPKKVGLAPVQRDGLEYEFDIVGEMNMENELIISKTRIPKLKGGVYAEPGKEFADLLDGWLKDGAPLFWVYDGGGQRFSARMRELGLKPDYVLLNLQPGAPLGKLGETTLTEAEALARLDELTQQGAE